MKMYNSLFINRAQIMGIVEQKKVYLNKKNEQESVRLIVATYSLWFDSKTNERSMTKNRHIVFVYPDSMVKFIQEKVQKEDLVFLEGTMRLKSSIDYETGDAKEYQCIIVKSTGLFKLMDIDEFEEYNETEIPEFCEKENEVLQSLS